MILQHRCHIVLLSTVAGAGKISKFIVQSKYFSGFCELAFQVQLNCCQDAGSSFMPLS
jgi:hypothetical protein